MKTWFSKAWCRIAYGHIMIPFGTEGPGDRIKKRTVWYMCARCLHCEILHYIGRNPEAE